MNKDGIYKIINDLNTRHRDKNFLLEYYVQNRLTESVESYYKELRNNFESLTNKNTIYSLKKVLKNL